VVAIYFLAAAQCSTIYSSTLELTDCICGWSVFGHHTVIAVDIILSKLCCTIFITCMVFVSSPSNISAEYKNVCTSVITRNTNIGY